MRPSLIWSAREARAATPMSCVIENERHAASRWSADEQIENVLAFSLSRLPVGSSASSTEGQFARLRAMATRWRSPPESLEGK